MPHFFFDIHDGQDSTDEVGLELPDFETARSQAIGVLPSVAREKLASGDNRMFHVVVRDERRPVFKATLSLCCRMLDET